MSRFIENAEFSISGINFTLDYNNKCDVYNLTMESDHFNNKFTFILINHGYLDVVCDILLQVLQRILSDSIGSNDKDELYMIEWFLKNGSLYGIGKDLIQEMVKYSKKLFESTVTPVLRDDYDTVLKGLKNRGLEVTRFFNDDYFGQHVDCYKIEHNDKTFVTPARHPPDWTQTYRHNNYDERPFYSLPYILEEIKGYFKLDDDMLNLMKIN